MVIGLAAAGTMLPGDIFLAHQGPWQHPGTDLAQNLAGHLAFQVPGWHWPLLLAPDLAWPHGTSIAMTDSNPLLSVGAKLLADRLGHKVNLFGVWLLIIWVLQPLSAVYAFRGFQPQTRRWEATLAVAVLSVLFPALLYRYRHINLLAHFLLLAALGLAARRRPTGWREAGLLLVTILIHPYLFLFVAATLAASPLQMLFDRQPGLTRACLAFLLACATSVGVYALLSGTLGGGDSRGYGFYSMNLLSPFWPQRSGLFGADLPIIDATGGQYEGFNYLGAGILVLALLAAPGLRWAALRRRLGLVMVLLCLTLVALTPHMFAGRFLIVPLGVRPWDQVLGTIQASGRAFWPVGYAILLLALARLSAVLPRMALRLVLALAVVLQIVDTAPLRAEAGAYYAGRAPDVAPPVKLPAGATLLRIVPVCPASGPYAEAPDFLRLEAVRAGMRLADMRASRRPSWFNCESAWTDGTELPLGSGEVRVFIGAPAIAGIRQDGFGPDAGCEGGPQLTICQGGSSSRPPLGLPLPRVSFPVALRGEGLRPLLSFGWKPDASGAFWSEGPRATLLFRLPPGQSHRLQLTLRGVARQAGGIRSVGLRVNDAAGRTIALPDQEDQLITLEDPAGSGIVRIAVDVDHPVDPASRGLSSPVHRAGVSLTILALSSEGTKE